MATRELAEIKDKNGDVNELRDKKLADSIAKNTVVNTDNVRMVDTNGKEVFIARDSFISAIRNVLGGFILSNTKAEAPNIPVFDSNGDFGAITAANLASVLGAGMKQKPPQGVYLEDVFGSLYIASTWDSSKIVNSIVVSTQNHCFRMAPIILSMPLWINKPDGYGNTIGFSTQDLSAFEQYPTPEQAETCFSGEKDTYSFNKMFSSKQNTVDMTYILGDAPVFCYNYKFNRGGNGYLMSAGEAKIIHNNITDIAAAYTAIGIPIGNPNLWTSTYCGVTSRGLQEFWVSNRGNLSIGGYWLNICGVIPLGRYY